MDIANLAPDLAKLFGVQPATLVLLLFIITSAANAGARLIPNDATGWLGTLRKVCALIGLYVSTRVTSGVTINEVAKAALNTPPITQKVAEAVPDLSLPRAGETKTTAPTRLVDPIVLHRAPPAPVIIAGVDVSRPEERRVLMAVPGVYAGERGVDDDLARRAAAAGDALDAHQPVDRSILDTATGRNALLAQELVRRKGVSRASLDEERMADDGVIPPREQPPLV